MNIKKNFIIIFVILLFCKQLNSITPTPIASYNSVTGSSGYMGPTSTLNSLAWGPSNNIMIGGIGGYCVMNFTGSSLGTPSGWQGGYNACVAYNPIISSGNSYAAAGYYSGAISGYIKLYNFTTNYQANSWSAGATVNLLAWSPDGTKLAALVGTSTLIIYSITIASTNTLQYTKLGTATIPGTATTLSWNQPSSAVVATSSSGIYVYNTTASLTSSISGTTFTAAAWNPSSNMNLYLAACSSSGTISIYKFTSITTAPTSTTFTKDFVATTYGNPTKISWSSDGTFLAVCSKTTPYVKTFKFTTSSLNDFGNPVSLPGNGTDIGWNFDNKFLAVTANTYLNIYSFSSVTTAPPVANFTSSVAGLTATFKDSSTNTPTSWSWNFGDGSSSTEKSPSHTYATGGTYTVKLTASNSSGSNSKTSTVTVASTPVANFSSSVAGLTATFTDSSTNTPTSWSWNFGESTSSSNTSTSQNPSHTYAKAGTYTVTLIATNIGGSSTAKTSTVSVASIPVANFSSSVAGLTATFTDSSTNTPTSWSWNFGDSSSSSNTSTLQNPSHTYSASGTYTVSLTSSNAGGSSTAKTISITVTAPPVANFTSSVTGLTATFKDSSTNSPTSWSWNFGDGSSSTSQNPSHSYSKSGNYSVSLIATNAGGSSTAKTISITITAPPVANFTSSASGLTATFTDSSTNSPTSWSWNFGDGSSSTSQNPSHSYSKSGNYSVSLIATNAGGSSTKTTMTINIVNPLDVLSGDVSLESMFNIINNTSFDASFQGTNGGDLIYSKLVWFYDNRSNIGLVKLSDGFSGLFDVAQSKTFLTDTQKQGISARIAIIGLEIGLTAALTTLNNSTDKLAAINTFLNTYATNTRDLRKQKAALLQ